MKTGDGETFNLCSTTKKNRCNINNMPNGDVVYCIDSLRQFNDDSGYSVFNALDDCAVNTNLVVRFTPKKKICSEPTAIAIRL